MRNQPKLLEIFINISFSKWLLDWPQSWSLVHPWIKIELFCSLRRIVYGQAYSVKHFIGLIVPIKLVLMGNGMIITSNISEMIIPFVHCLLSTVTELEHMYHAYSLMKWLNVPTYLCAFEISTRDYRFARRVIIFESYWEILTISNIKWS